MSLRRWCIIGCAFVVLVHYCEDTGLTHGDALALGVLGETLPERGCIGCVLCERACMSAPFKMTTVIFLEGSLHFRDASLAVSHAVEFTVNTSIWRCRTRQRACISTGEAP